MATVNTPYADPGRAAFEELDTYVQDFLLAGNHPELAQPFSYPAAAGAVIAQFAVVGLDGSGDLAFATFDQTVQAIGVVAQGFSNAAAGSAPVFYQGAFNIDALVWDATFDTDAKKLAAFQGAPTPTQIVLAKR